MNDHSMHGRIVTIFGGARCNADAVEYREAERLGGLLASEGFTVCTGGYNGVMEAASKGAHRAGGKVIGVTMNQFKAQPNPWLTHSHAADHFYERLQRLIQSSVAFVAFKGGMGTVTEVSLVWNKLTTKVMEPRPLILVGECWPGVVDAWRSNLVVSEEDVSILHLVDDANGAFSVVNGGSE